MRTEPTLRPDVERCIVIIVAVFFLIVGAALAVSTILWPGY